MIYGSGHFLRAPLPIYGDGRYVRPPLLMFGPVLQNHFYSNALLLIMPLLLFFLLPLDLVDSLSLFARDRGRVECD